jgi:hypothetical protein
MEEWQKWISVIVAAVSFALMTIGVYAQINPSELSRKNLRRIFWLTLAAGVVAIASTSALVVWTYLSRIDPEPENYTAKAEATPTTLETETTPPRTSPTVPIPDINAKEESVLLPTPTKIEILSAEADDSEIWDPRDFGYINERGEWQLTARWDRVGSYRDGLACVRDPYEQGRVAESFYYIDRRGSAVLNAPGLRQPGAFSDGLASAKPPKTPGFGYINRTGEFAIPPVYSNANDFSEGMAAVQLDWQNWGFIDRHGRLVIPARWTEAGAFSEGVAPVAHGKKWGYIDRSGRTVIKFTWDSAAEFRSGLATVRRDGRCAVIDKTGAVVLSGAYEEIGQFSNGAAAARRNRKYGLIDSDGNELIPFEWDWVLNSSAQEPSGSIYWLFARRAGADSATIAWFKPDREELWRATIPLLRDTPQERLE